MKVIVYKVREGTFGYAIKRTRRDEGPSQLHRSLPKHALKDALRKAIDETLPEMQQASLELS